MSKFDVCIPFIPIIIVLLAVYLFLTPMSRDFMYSKKLYTVKLYSSSGEVIRQWNAIKFRAGNNRIWLKDGNKKVFICGNVVAEEHHANNNY